MNAVGTSHEHDTSIEVWFEGTGADLAATAMRANVIRLLRARGFRISRDEMHDRLYPPLAGQQHIGSKGHLEVETVVSGRHLSVVFFQNLVTVNPNGGKFDFDKRLKMSYLMGKTYEATRRAIGALLCGHGIELKPAQKRVGMDFINASRGPNHEFHDEPYNTKMADGGRCLDGMLIYFFGADYRPRRGIAWHNINNMWWVLSGPTEVRNLASWELHTRESIGALRGRRVPPPLARKRLALARDQAVRTERYERAAAIRDVIRAKAFQDAYHVNKDRSHIAIAALVPEAIHAAVH